MVRLALADTSGMTRWATSPLVVPPAGDEGGALARAGGLVTTGAGGGVAGDAGCDLCDRVSAKTITMSTTATAARIAARGRLDRAPWMTSSGRCTALGGAS